MSEESYKSNGLYHEVDRMKGQIKAIETEMTRRDDLLINELKGLSMAVSQGFQGFSLKLDTFMDIARKSLPISAVIWLMVIMTVGLIGIEGIKELKPLIHFWITGAK